MQRRDVILGLGSAAVGPVRAGWAQERRVPVLGFVSSRSAAESAELFGAFRKGLTAYFKDSNVAIESRWADGRYERLPALVADLLTYNPSVLVAVGGEPSALAAKSAMATVPVVFVVGTD